MSLPQKFLVSRRVLASRLEALLGTLKSARCRNGDDGFTMIELIMAMTIIAIVMAAFSTFFITTVYATSRQSTSQAATQLGDDAIERARAIKGSSLISGRDKTSSDAEWSSPVPGVAAFLSGLQEAYDSSVTTGGATAPLPTTYRQATINNLVYNQYWYIGSCWRTTSSTACTSTNPAGGTVANCAASPNYCQYQVVAAITWPNKSCAASLCSYVTSTLDQRCLE